jgi:hypothetical protein
MKIKIFPLFLLLFKNYKNLNKASPNQGSFSSSSSPSPS